MIVDTHTHFWDVNEHLAPDAAAALGSIMTRPERLDIRIGDFVKNMASIDRCFVYGLRARFSGFAVPHDALASFVAEEPTRFVGIMGLDPNDADMLDQFERGRQELGMKGVVLSPDLGSFDPRDARLKDVYTRAVKYGLPIFIHNGQFPIARAALKHASPMLLDDVARTFPELNIVICHAGRPFVSETIAMMYKHPYVFADLAGLMESPWELYCTLQMASEYRVLSRFLFASDYPFTIPRENFVRVQAAGSLSKGTNMPALSDAVLTEVLHRNPFKLLGIPLDVRTRGGAA